MHKSAHQFIAETFVSIADAKCVVNQLCKTCCDYCLSIDSAGADKLLTFEDGRAILRPADTGLNIRVEGQDLVILCGVRMYLQWQLAKVAASAAENLEWWPAGRVPFSKVEVHLC